MRLFLLLLVLGASSNGIAKAPYRVLYPYGLLSEDYGILDEETDLAVDTWRGTPHPYQEQGFNGGYPYWECFPTKHVSIQYEKWRAPNPMGEFNKIVSMCSLDFIVKTSTDVHIYTGTRGYPDGTCKELIADWKNITRGQSHVCFNGRGGESEPRKNYVEVRTEKIWTWDRIKTKKGCMSYFYGHCSLDYWKKYKKKKF